MLFPLKDAIFVVAGEGNKGIGCWVVLETVKNGRVQGVCRREPLKLEVGYWCCSAVAVVGSSGGTTS